MKMPTCEAVRDRLPELESGTLTADEAVTIEHHIELCAECASEREVLTLLRAGVPRPPADLQARIARSVRVGAPLGARRPVPSFAMAAGVVFVLLTGSLLLRNGVGPAADLQPVGDTEVTFGWPSVDPILRAAPVLNDLTMEELESLLAELES